MIKAKAKSNDPNSEIVEVKPESRLPPMIPAGILLPVGLFIYGWTAEKHVCGKVVHFRVTGFYGPDTNIHIMAGTIHRPHFWNPPFRHWKPRLHDAYHDLSRGLLSTLCCQCTCC